MKFYLLLSISIIFSSCATMMGTQASEEMKTLEKIIEFENLSKDELYIRANEWFVDVFNSAESVIEFQDKEAGKIIGKYTFSYAEGVYTYNMKQTVSIDIKNEKVRIIFKNPTYQATSGLGETYHNMPYRELKTLAGVERAREQWEEMALSLEKSIKEAESW